MKTASQHSLHPPTPTPQPDGSLSRAEASHLLHAASPCIPSMLRRISGLIKTLGAPPQNRTINRAQRLINFAHSINLNHFQLTMWHLRPGSTRKTSAIHVPTRTIFGEQSVLTAIRSGCELTPSSTARCRTGWTAKRPILDTGHPHFGTPQAHITRLSQLAPPASQRVPLSTDLSQDNVI